MRYLKSVVGLLLVLNWVACDGQNPSAQKPDFDPDQGLVANGKGDFASDYLTTIAGELTLNQTKSAQIGFGVYLQGYTVVLAQGQQIAVEIRANEAGRFAIYGPATDLSGGKPRFKAALAKGETREDGTRHVVEYSFLVKQPGTYLVAYGPKFVWGASYTVSVSCSNCGFCSKDADCKASEFCPAETPCTSTYCVEPGTARCEPRRVAGESCQRSGMCESTLACDDHNQCILWEPKPQPNDPSLDPSSTRWRCVENVRPGYYHNYCLTVEASWNAQSGACSFKVFRSPKAKESLECTGQQPKLWISAIECKKWENVTYDVLSSHRFYEDSLENKWVALMLRLSGGVVSGNQTFEPLLGYTEDPDYLGANFSHDLNCTREN